MKIKESHRNLIVEEMDFANKKMNESQDGLEKIYYFSAIFGVLHRIFNTEFNSELLYIHFILRATHEAFQNRLNAIIKGGDTSVKLTDAHFDKLSALSKELCLKLKNKQEVNETLKKFINLTYSTTGNGHYLMEKGWLKI
jgi:hypothetical protein